MGRHANVTSADASRCSRHAGAQGAQRLVALDRVGTEGLEVYTPAHPGISHGAQRGAGRRTIGQCGDAGAQRLAHAETRGIEQVGLTEHLRPHGGERAQPIAEVEALEKPRSPGEFEVRVRVHQARQQHGFAECSCCPASA
jgi:hypothetical protein